MATPNPLTSEKKLIDKFVREGAEASSMRPACLKKWGWSFCLNQIVEGRWTFSAKLVPPGRSSNEKDWHRLGRVVSLVYAATGHDADAGMPEPLTPLEQTPPNATHYWMWPVVEGAPAA